MDLATRWLLVLRAEPEQNEEGMIYGLWLCPLDERTPTPPRRCATVDELWTALFAAPASGSQTRER